MSSLNARKVASSGGNFNIDPLEAGTYPIRLVQVISLGLQPQRPFKGEEKPPKQEIMLTYEFLDEFLKDEDGKELEDKPRWLSETLPLNNLENDRANSTKRYYAFDPSEDAKGDWTELVGTPAMATVVLNASRKDPNKIFENIASVSTMRAKEAGKAADLVNPTKVFDIDDPDMGVFNSLPEWIQNKMKDNLEFSGSPLEEALGAADGVKAKENGPDEDDGGDW
jgi:hypothetical protein